MRVAVLLLVLAACHATTPPAPTPSPPADRDGPGTTIGAACAKLRELDCPEGLPTKAGRTCYEHLADLEQLAPVPSTCLASASSQDAARACGDASTTRVRCQAD